MTRGEMDKLDVFLGEFRAFIEADTSWKSGTDGRLRKVEEFVTSKKAIAERDAARGVSTRAYVASTIAAIGIVVSLVIGIMNYLML